MFSFYDHFFMFFHIRLDSQTVSIFICRNICAFSPSTLSALSESHHIFFILIFRCLSMCRQVSPDIQFFPVLDNFFSLFSVLSFFCTQLKVHWFTSARFICFIFPSISCVMKCICTRRCLWLKSSFPFTINYDYQTNHRKRKKGREMHIETKCPNAEERIKAF